MRNKSIPSGLLETIPEAGITWGTTRLFFKPLIYHRFRLRKLSGLNGKYLGWRSACGRNQSSYRNAPVYFLEPYEGFDPVKCRLCLRGDGASE